MRTPRQSPHRPKREVQEIRAAEVQEYRSENQRLRRENSRLRKEIEKYVAAWEGTGGDEETMADTDTDPKTKASTSKCPECGGHNIIRVPIGTKVLVGCRDCKHRLTG